VREDVGGVNLAGSNLEYRNQRRPHDGSACAHHAREHGHVPVDRVAPKGDLQKGSSMLRSSFGLLFYRRAFQLVVDDNETQI
jgi:hypothetical protein